MREKLVFRFSCSSGNPEEFEECKVGGEGVAFSRILSYLLLQAPFRVRCFFRK